MASKKRTALLPEEMSPKDVLRATWAALLLLNLNGRPATPRAPRKQGKARIPAADLGTLVAHRLPVATATAQPASRRKAARQPAPPRSWYWRY
jgi:hypothetical protein